MSDHRDEPPRVNLWHADALHQRFETERNQSHYPKFPNRERKQLFLRNLWLEFACKLFGDGGAGCAQGLKRFVVTTFRFGR